MMFERYPRKGFFASPVKKSDGILNECLFRSGVTRILGTLNRGIINGFKKVDNELKAKFIVGVLPTKRRYYTLRDFSKDKDLSFLR